MKFTLVHKIWNGMVINIVLEKYLDTKYNFDHHT